MGQINWKQKRSVYVNREFSVAFVRLGVGRYQEFDDYREDGGPVESTLPPYSEFLGDFTNAEISNMEYPNCM